MKPSRMKAVAQRLARVSLIAFVAGGLVTIAVSGVIYGVRIDRLPPTIYNMRVLAPAHAGGNVVIVEDIRVPPNCLPRFMRKLVKDRDPLLNKETMVLTDSSIVATGIIMIPIPNSTNPGDWFFEERLSTTGCGAFSGILPPLVGDAYDTNGKLGVPVTVLPREPVPTN